MNRVVQHGRERSALGGRARRQRVRDPRPQLGYVNAARTFHPGADEGARAESPIPQHASDPRLRLLATRALMRGRWRGNLWIGHDRPPAVTGRLRGRLKTQKNDVQAVIQGRIEPPYFWANRHDMSRMRHRAVSFCTRRATCPGSTTAAAGP